MVNFQNIMEKILKFPEREQKMIDKEIRSDWYQAIHDTEYKRTMEEYFQKSKGI